MDKFKKNLEMTFICSIVGFFINLFILSVMFRVTKDRAVLVIPLFTMITFALNALFTHTVIKFTKWNS
jgi:hypothetical protein